MKIWKRLTAAVLVILLLVAAPAVMATEEEEPNDAVYQERLEKLVELLDIASRIQEGKYTSDSWQVLQDAIVVGNAAMESGELEEILTAIQALSVALTNLISMNYEAMEAAIAEAEQFMGEHDGNWTALVDAIAAARATYGCGNQAAVDQATQQILDCLEDCRDSLNTDQPEETEPSTGTQPEEKEEDKEENPKKNLVLWIVLSCVVVAAGVAAAVWFIQKKKGNRNKQIDDMPLVDYDIDDDID